MEQRERRLGGRALAGGEPRGVPDVRARPARPRRGARAARAARRASSRGSTELAERSRAQRESASAGGPAARARARRSCRTCSRTRASRSPSWPSDSGRPARARAGPRAAAHVRAPAVHRRPAHRRVGHGRRQVEIRLAEYFERPLRLTPGRGPRARSPPAGHSSPSPAPTRRARSRRALDKLEDAVGASRAARRSTSARRRTSTCSRDAVDDREQLELDYFSYARDEMTNAPRRSRAGLPCARGVVPRRVVPPRRRRAPVPGRPRPGRARRRRATSTRRPPRRRRDPPTSCTTRSPTTRASRCDLAPGAELGRRELPHEKADASAADGSWQVVLAVSEPAWLERLLLALGPGRGRRGPTGAPGPRAPRPPPRLRARYALREPRRPSRVLLQVPREDGAVEHPS